MAFVSLDASKPARTLLVPPDTITDVRHGDEPADLGLLKVAGFQGSPALLVFQGQPPSVRPLFYQQFSVVAELLRAAFIKSAEDPVLSGC